MSNYPEARVPDVELVSVKKLDITQVFQTAEQLYRLTNSPNTIAELHRRGRQGTIKRYSQSVMGALENLEVLQKQSQLEAFVVRSEIGSVIGMATIQKYLPLYEPNLPFLPAAVERKLGLSIPVSTPDFNVSGWVDAQSRAELGSEVVLREVYKQLRHEVPDSWTVEPLASGHDTHHAIMNADFMPVDGSVRFDELETPWWPPVSQLYLGRTAVISS